MLKNKSKKVCWIFLIGLTPLLSIAQNGDSLSSKGSFAVFPAFGYQPETSMQLGAVAIWALKSKDKSQSLFQRQSTFTPFILYTFRNQVLSEMNLDYYFSNGLNLNISPRFFNYPDFYFGVGNDTDPDTSESYTNVYAQLEGQFYIPLSSKVFLGTAFDLHSTHLRDKLDGGMLASENLPGVEGGNILGMGPAFKFDSRNSVIYPTKGYLFAAQSVFNLLGDFNYNRYEVDFRKYFSARSEAHVFAWQVNARFSSEGAVPFYKLPQLGGDNRLRGIANASLYRDKQALFSQFEYRKHLLWRFGMVAFIGVGDVANKIDDFNISEFKYVFGSGLRFAVLPEQKLNLRFDFGVSQGGQTGFYVGMREAF